uniref:Uncharacterized protein n=1 Tax=Arundo donax TaxID=35708 RepID=A0A0A9BG15_ARUDO
MPIENRKKEITQKTE